MKYLFILGRNPELSQREIQCFFETRGVGVVSEILVSNGLLVEFKGEIDFNVVDKLGGVISIGEVMAEFRDVEDLDKIDIYDKEKNNFSYVVWDFSERKEDVSDYLKKRFRSEKLKASEKRMREDMILQDGSKVKSVGSNVEEEYFVFNDDFGKIIKRCNYEEIEERDMEKPVRRESLSISPRLAKIMINLSKVKEKEMLVDAFCGIGVILQEALLQNIKVVGIDNDKKAIKGAQQNMKWFAFSPKEYMLLKGDSGEIEIGSVQGLVSEPDFGETLRKIPIKEKAEGTIMRYEKIMISVLNNMKKYVGGRFVFTSPYIRIGKRRIGVDFVSLSEKIGFKLVEGFPMPEFRENQIVGREIVVFEK